MSEFGRLGAGEIDRLLGEARVALAGLQRVTNVDAGAEVAESSRVVVSGANDLVKAEVSAGGRLEKLTIESRAMRMDSQTLAEELTKAVRAAQDEALARQGELANQLPMVDEAQLAERLDETQWQATRQLDVFGEALEGVIRKLDQR